MRFEIGDKRKEGLLSLDEVEAITITVKGIKYIIKEGINDGIILVKYDKESVTDSLSITPILNSSIAIK
jgi:hypothetical protein